MVKYLLFKYLRFDPSQPFITLTAVLAFVGVGLGVAVLIIAMAIMSGFDREFERKLFVMNYPLTIVSGFKRDFTQRDVELLKANFPHLRFSPFISTQIMLRGANRINGAMMFGVNFSDEAAINPVFKAAWESGQGQLASLAEWAGDGADLGGAGGLGGAAGDLSVENLSDTAPNSNLDEIIGNNAGENFPQNQNQNQNSRENLAQNQNENGREIAAATAAAPNSNLGENPAPNSNLDENQTKIAGENFAQNPATAQAAAQTQTSAQTPATAQTQTPAAETPIPRAKLPFHIVVGTGAAGEFNLNIGGKVTAVFMQLEAAGFAVIPRMKNFEVAGIFSSGLSAYDKGYTYANIEALQRVLGYDGGTFDGIHAYSADPRADIAALNAFLGFGKRAVGWWEQNGNFFSALELEKRALFIVLMLIILVASLNIVSSLLMNVMNRRSEIALLLALGASEAEVRRSFFAQGLVIGLGGVVLGALVGLGGYWVLGAFDIISLPADVYGSSKLPLELGVLDFCAIIAGAIGIVIISSLYPAHKAAKIDVLDTLRNE